MARQARQVFFYLNGKPHSVAPGQELVTLGEYLRTQVGLCGTKIVCAEGDCGACTVLHYSPVAETTGSVPHFLPINSCVVFTGQMHGASVVTVDALAESKAGEREKLSAAQSAVVAEHGSQCGYCTPGFVVALTGLLEERHLQKNPAPLAEREARNALTGNLCRCTGYRPILRAATEMAAAAHWPVHERFYSRDQDDELRALCSTPLEADSSESVFLAPTSIAAAVQVLAARPAMRIVGGATDLAVLHNKRKALLHQLVSLHLIPELYTVREPRPDRLEVGARVSLRTLRQSVRSSMPELASFLDIFASPQIKNIATVVGNLANASPIGDLSPFFLIADTDINIATTRGRRKVAIQDFFVGYRKTALAPDEVIASIELAIVPADHGLRLYKASARKDLDISAVSLAARAVLGRDGTFSDVRLAAGGIAGVSMRLPRTEEALSGRRIDAAAVDHVHTVLQGEITPRSDVRGSAAFRRIVLGNLLKRYLGERLTRAGD